MANKTDRNTSVRDAGLSFAAPVVRMGVCGTRLCRHTIAGGCTRWCSYKLFTKAVAITAVVLGLIVGGVWLTGGEGQGRVRDLLLGLGAYLVLVVPGIVFLNSRDRD
jgi:hypothetical protein